MLGSERQEQHARADAPALHGAFPGVAGSAATAGRVSRCSPRVPALHASAVSSAQRDAERARDALIDANREVSWILRRRQCRLAGQDAAGDLGALPAHLSGRREQSEQRAGLDQTFRKSDDRNLRAVARQQQSVDRRRD